jgi:enterochelin esterase family protein
VPKQYNAAKPACVYVNQDSIQYEAPKVFDNLIHKKEMPVTIGIFIQPGEVPLKEGEAPRKRPDGRPAPRRNRSVEYDTLSDTYAKFLLEEILPEVGKKYNLTKDPEGRCIGGNSSGGICAFTVAWERPDQFRKVFSTVGSFTDIRGGHAYPYMIRKSEKKPIRVFLQDGANDLDNTFGNWPLANQLMASSLKFKGYDYKFEFGEGVHSTRHGTAIFPDAMRWMWRDYPKE